MALIKCSECGKQVSDKADACPHCGCPMDKKNFCSECGKEIKENDKVCPNCGCPLEANKTKTIAKVWLIVCIIILFLISGLCFIAQDFLKVNEDIVNTPMGGLITLILGFAYRLFTIDLNKNNYYLILGISLIMLIYGIFDLNVLINFILVVVAVLNVVITTLLVRKSLKKNKINIKEYIVFIAISLLSILIYFILQFSGSNKLVCTYKNNNDVGDIAYEMTYTFKNDTIKELKGYQYAKPSDANVAEALWQITNKDQDQYNHYEGLTYDATFSEDKEIIMHYSIDAEKAPTMFATVSSLSGVKGIEKSMTKDAVKSIYEENGFTCK